jgi:fatty acid synthase, animal type
LFAQIAQIDLLTAIGIKPDGIIGHSMGETAAAYADGCATMEEALLASYYRVKVSNEVDHVAGAMAVVGKLDSTKSSRLNFLFLNYILFLFTGMGYSEIKDILPSEIEVACHNSNKNCTISGPKEQVKQMVQDLEQKGIFAALFHTDDVAFHSRLMKEIGDRYNQIMGSVRHSNCYPQNWTLLLV